MVLKAMMALVVCGLTAIAAVKGVGFLNEDYLGNTAIPFTASRSSLVVDLVSKSGSDSCPTCIFADSDGTLLDYYGRPIDMRLLSVTRPSATLPLRPSFAPDTISHLEPTSTHPVVSQIAPSPKPATTVPAFTLLYYIGQLVKTMSASISRLRRQKTRSIARGVIYAVIWTISSTAAVPFLPRQLDFRNISIPATAKVLLRQITFHESHWLKSKGLGKDVTSQAEAQLLTKANRLLKDLNAIPDQYSRDPAKMIPAVRSRLTEYVSDEAASRTEWQAAEKGRLNRIANHRFKQLRKIHENELKATYVRDVARDVAAAKGVKGALLKQITAAKSDFQTQIERLGLRKETEETVGVISDSVLVRLNLILRTAISDWKKQQDEYVSVIAEQKAQIQSLRLQLKGRAETCEVDKHAAQPRNADGQEDQDLQDDYSTKDGESFNPPLDDFTALNMDVSLSPRQFSNRSDADLDADPRWHQYLAKIAEENAVHEGKCRSVEERHSSKTKVQSGTRDTSEQDDHDCSQKKDETSSDDNQEENANGIRNASGGDGNGTPQPTDLSTENGEGKVESVTKASEEEKDHDGSKDDQISFNENEEEPANGIRAANEEEEPDTLQSDNKDRKDGGVEVKSDTGDVGEKDDDDCLQGDDGESLAEDREEEKKCIKDGIAHTSLDASGTQDAESRDTKLEGRTGIKDTVPRNEDVVPKSGEEVVETAVEDEDAIRQDDSRLPRNDVEPNDDEAKEKTGIQDASVQHHKTKAHPPSLSEEGNNEQKGKPFPPTDFSRDANNLSRSPRATQHTSNNPSPKKHI